MLHLFSASPDQVTYGAEHYRLRSVKISTVINDLFKEYRIEGLTMLYTMEEYLQEKALELLPKLTPEQRVAGLAPEERLAGLRPKDIENYLKRLRSKLAARKKSRDRRKK